jgi:hypothetical protein
MLSVTTVNHWHVVWSYNIMPYSVITKGLNLNGYIVFVIIICLRAKSDSITILNII